MSQLAEVFELKWAALSLSKDLTGTVILGVLTVVLLALSASRTT